MIEASFLWLLLSLGAVLLLGAFCGLFSHVWGLFFARYGGLLQALRPAVENIWVRPNPYALFIGAVTALLVFWVFVFFPQSELGGASSSYSLLYLALAGAIWFLLLLLAFMDFHSLRLPDFFTFSLMFLGLGERALTLSWHFSLLWPYLVAGLLAYVFFTAIDIFYRYWRGQAGLGRGDAKLLAGGALLLGPGALPLLIFLAALGSLLAVALHFFMQKHAAGKIRVQSAVLPEGNDQKIKPPEGETDNGQAVTDEAETTAYSLSGQAVPFGPGLAGAIFVLWLAREMGWRYF